MSEEKKEKPEAKAVAPAKEEKPEGEKESRLKVTQMTLQQVEAAMEQTTKSMGGLHSRFGRALVERKAFLLKYK